MLNNMVYCSYCKVSFDLPRWMDEGFVSRGGGVTTVNVKHKYCGKSFEVTLRLAVAVEQQVNSEEDEEEDSDE